MIIAYEPGVIVEYTLTDDAGPEKSVFSIASLDVLARSWIDDEVSRLHGAAKDEKAERSFTYNIRARDLWFVKFGLKGWKSFRNSKGQEIAFETVEVSIPTLGKRTIVSDESLRRLKLEWVEELAKAIVSANTVSEQDAKNSVSPV